MDTTTQSGMEAFTTLDASTRESISISAAVASRSTTTTPQSTPVSTSSSSTSTYAMSSELPASMSTATSAPFNPVNVADMSHSMQHFGYVDYFVFILMLVVCAVIGFYFGFIERKKKKAKKHLEERRGSEALDYLVGGRKMKVVPVSLSLVASFISGISLLGTSTEIYVYGTQYAFILITLIISGVISWYIFLPVFCNLQLTSTYEYFERRFDKSIRLLGSVLFTIGTLMWLPIVIYVPALAFNQVTGINIHIITPVVCVVCIFYTCVGGLKAVVWTDVIQTVIMMGSIVLVIVKGTLDVGGLDVVWQRNMDSGRIEMPSFTWDPTVRLSVLSIFIGYTVFHLQCTSGNQVIMQRYLSVPNLKEAKKACVLFTIGVTLLTLACFYNGLLIFATYHDCDPLSTKLAKAKDQLVPLLVMDILGVFPGMPGLFVAGVFSAALSSLSTGLNSLSAVFLEDYIKPLRKTPLSEYQTAIIMRASVVIIGVICVALVFVVERLGTVLQLSMTLGSITCGPLLGLFIAGLLMPWLKSKNVWTGSICAFVIMAWICVKGQLAIAAGELVYPEKSVTTEGCTYSFEATMMSSNSSAIADGSRTFGQYIYHMSFMYYATVGCLLNVFFSCVSCVIWGCNDTSALDANLFPPCMQRFIKPSEYISVQAEDQTVIMTFDTKDAVKA